MKKTEVVKNIMIKTDPKPTLVVEGYITGILIWKLNLNLAAN